MCAYTASAPCAYKPRKAGKSILELKSFSFLKKHLPPLFISTESGVLPDFLALNAPHYNTKMSQRIKAQLRMKTIILWLERTAGREKLFVGNLWDLPQNWVSLGISITTDFFKQPSRCKQRFQLPNKLYPDTFQSTSFYKLLNEVTVFPNIPYLTHSREVPTLHHFGANLLRSSNPPYF